MPEYKFHYFNFRGRGEACRILLVLAGAYWEDIRTEFGDDFLPLKESKWTNYVRSYVSYTYCIYTLR